MWGKRLWVALRLLKMWVNSHTNEGSRRAVQTPSLHGWPCTGAHSDLRPPALPAHAMSHGYPPSPLLSCCKYRCCCRCGIAQPKALALTSSHTPHAPVLHGLLPPLLHFHLLLTSSLVSRPTHKPCPRYLLLTQDVRQVVDTVEASSAGKGYSSAIRVPIWMPAFTRRREVR